MLLKLVRQGINEDIHKALIAIWDEHGVSLVHLGKLERVMYAAYGESFDMICYSTGPHCPQCAGNAS